MKILLFQRLLSSQWNCLSAQGFFLMKQEGPMFRLTHLSRESITAFLPLMSGKWICHFVVFPSISRLLSNEIHQNTLGSVAMPYGTSPIC